MSKTDSKPAAAKTAGGKDSKAGSAKAGDSATGESTAASESTAGGDTASESKTADSAAGGGPSGGGGGRPISHFSSVSTPAYRSGWSEIFGQGKGAAKKSGTGRRKAAPLPEVVLEFDSLPADLQDALAAEARARLGRRKAGYERARKAGTVRWELVCRFD